MSKESYFFSHDCNARNDERILMLRADHGLEGYGIYWALVEMMFESSETALYHDKVKGMALSYNLVITKLQDVIKSCITEELFESDGIMFWSNSLRRRKDKYHSLKQKRSDGGKKAMENRWNKTSDMNISDNSVISELQVTNNDDITRDNKGKEKRERKGDEKRENKETSNSRFTPPTQKEVEDYCKERGNYVDANKFVNFYEAKGWMIGKNKMKNWKSAIITWEKGSSNNGAPNVDRTKNTRKLEEWEIQQLEQAKRLSAEGKLFVGEIDF